MPGGPRGEGYRKTRLQDAAFVAEKGVDFIGSIVPLPSTLIIASPLDVERFANPNIDNHTAFGFFGTNGQESPDRSLKAAQLLFPASFLNQAVLLTGHTNGNRHENNDHSHIENPLPQSTVDFKTRAAERPAEWEDYFITSPDGERRFDFDNKKHRATMNYIGYVDQESGNIVPGAYERFQADPSEHLAQLTEDFGVDTVEEVRERMMNGSTKRPPIIDNRFVVPNKHHQPNIGKGHYDGDFFGWDNRWSVQWAVGREDLKFAQGVMDDVEYIYKAVGYVPNSNNIKIMDRYQPFVETFMLSDIDKKLPDTQAAQDWRDNKVGMLKSMYFNVWVNDPEGEAMYDTYEGREGHSTIWENTAITPTGLPRYSGADVPGNHYSAEAGSGEDETPRFKGRAADHNATDLTGLIGIAQRFFYKDAVQKGNMEEAAHWEIEWNKTRELANKYHWNEELGFPMDYNFKTEQQSDVMALAGYMYALAGFDTEGSIAQSENGNPSRKLRRMVANLKKFELPYGLATTTGEEGPTSGREPDEEQWRYPYVWGPRVDLVFSLLKHNPEFHPELEETATRYMIGNDEFHARYGTLAETLDGITGGLSPAALYPRETNHEGFMWTAAVQARAEKLLKSIYQRKVASKAAVKLAGKMYETSVVDKVLAGELIRFANGDSRDPDVLQVGKQYLAENGVLVAFPIPEISEPDRRTFRADGSVKTHTKTVVEKELVTFSNNKRNSSLF